MKERASSSSLCIRCAHETKGEKGSARWTGPGESVCGSRTVRKRVHRRPEPRTSAHRRRRVHAPSPLHTRGPIFVVVIIIYSAVIRPIGPVVAERRVSSRVDIPYRPLVRTPDEFDSRTPANGFLITKVRVYILAAVIPYASVT